MRNTIGTSGLLLVALVIPLPSPTASAMRRGTARIWLVDGRVSELDTLSR